MGLISDRKNKKKEAFKNNVNAGGLGSFHPSYHHGGIPISTQGHVKGGLKKGGIFGPQVLPGHGHHAMGRNRGGSQPSPQKYPAGYYTTPVHHTSGNSGNASWSHPNQPRYNPNVNPRYQTWVAPRKQPALGQLVRKKSLCEKMMM